MHGNFPYLFDFWADPFVHLFILQSSNAKLENEPSPASFNLFSVFSRER